MIRNQWRVIARRSAIYLLLWWLLADGDNSSWWVGVPAVMLVVVLSVVVLPPVRFSWAGVIRFLPFFLVHSLRGGVDVAWRAFHPATPVNPSLFEYSLRLPPGAARVFLANMVSLLPGTLSTGLSADTLQLHVLDAGNDYLAELVAVEAGVARIFGVPLQAAA